MKQALFACMLVSPASSPSTDPAYGSFTEHSPACKRQTPDRKTRSCQIALKADASRRHATVIFQRHPELGYACNCFAPRDGSFFRSSRKPGIAPRAVALGNEKPI